MRAHDPSPRRPRRSPAAIPAGRRGKWLVLAAWLLIAALASPFAGKLTSAQKNNAASYLPDSAESTRAFNLQRQLPGGQTMPVVAVYHRAGGLTQADRAKVAADRQALQRRYPQSPPTPPAPSRDGTAVLYTVPLPGGDDVTTTLDAVKAIRAAVGQGGDGLDVKVTGPGGFLTDSIGVFNHIDTTLLLATVLVVAILLLLTYRSPVLWLVPLLAVGLANRAATAVVYGLAKHAGLTVNGQSASVLTVLVFGAGTDYAVLVICGRWLFWPFVPRYGSPSSNQRGPWARIGAAGPAPPTAGMDRHHAAAGRAGRRPGRPEHRPQPARRLPQHRRRGRRPKAHRHQLPAGASTPATVVARAGAAGAVQAAIATTPGIAAVRPSGHSDDLAAFSVTLRAEPGTQPAFATIDRLRARVHRVGGAAAVVGGPDATSLDVKRITARDRKVIIPLVLAVVLLILGLLLRAVTAPLLLIATVIGSFAAALGASALVFDKLFGFPGADASLPLFAFVFLVALGIDYNIFLMSRVREESAHLGTRQGTLKGLAVTGGVITSAGLVLAATFSVLGVLPLVATTELGFTVAFGVLLDTLVVRSILVPALATDLDRRIWWPSALSRRPAAPPTREPQLAGRPTHNSR